MNELSERLYKLAKKCGKPEFDKYESRILAELELMQQMYLLKDIQKIYDRVSVDPNLVGKDNKPNSMLAYCLGITTKKPDGEFINEKRRTYGRDGFPDIDMDFDYSRRHEIIEYLMRKYGDEYVGNIGTVQTLKTRAAIRRVVKVLDPDHSIVFEEGKKPDQSENFKLQNEILSSLPDPKMPMKRSDGSLVKNIQEAYSLYRDFARKMDAYPDVFRVAKKMEGNISAMGCHAAGVLISPEPLSRICPLHVTHGTTSDENEDVRKSANKTVATQFTMEEVEDLGLIKFDILGLSTKTALSLAVKWIKQYHNIDIDLSNLPLDDQETLKLLTKGDTNGCFQAEKIGMQQTFREIGIDSFDDLVIAVAMYRPGPKDYIPELANRKNGSHHIQYSHPLMKKITQRTYGIMAYQEQVMQAFMALANLTASDGYSFMKGCAKKKQYLIDEYKSKFIQGATNKGIAENIIQKIWADMEKFGGYAFNASHATSYAYECWKTAYLKAHFPVEFMGARLSVEAMRRDFDLVDKYEKDCKNHNISILPPDINRSKMYYAKVGEKTLLSPLILKGIGDKAAEEIIKYQPYKGKDLVFAVASKVGKVVNSKVVEALCDAKLFGDIKKSAVLQAFETIRKDRRASKGRQVGDIFA